MRNNYTFDSSTARQVEKKAKDLKAGDVISSGTITYVGSVGSNCGSKNQVRIDIRYNGKPEGEYATRYWNANTTIKVSA